MRIRMLAEHRELQINHVYTVPDLRGAALVRDGYAAEVSEPERAVAPPAPEKAVAPPARRAPAPRKTRKRKSR